MRRITTINVNKSVPPVWRAVLMVVSIVLGLVWFVVSLPVVAVLWLPFRLTVAVAQLHAVREALRRGYAEWHIVVNWWVLRHESGGSLVQK